MELKNIIGGVLGSVAEARSMSDRTSRELAILYEQDELMRAFPVPRMEVDKIDIDLKFVIQGGGDPYSIEKFRSSDTVRLTAVRTRNAVTEAIAGGKLNQVLSFPRIRDYEKLGFTVEQVITSLLQPPSELAANTPVYADVELITFDVEECVRRIIEEWTNNGLATLKSDNAPLILKDFLTIAQQKHEEEVSSLRLPEQLSPIQAVFTYRDLVELPTQVLSTIKMSINVRNYEWTQVGESYGEPLRKLVPE